MKLLGWWLALVGTLRLASVWFGFFDIWALQLAVFSKTTMTEVHGRTFGVWTLLTCTLCYICAFNLNNKPLYLATLLSFIYAFGHFLTEYFIYHTMAIGNLTTVGIFAGTSIIWMLLQWNSHQPVTNKHEHKLRFEKYLFVYASSSAAVNSHIIWFTLASHCSLKTF